MFDNFITSILRLILMMFIMAVGLGMLLVMVPYIVAQIMLIMV